MELAEFIDDVCYCIDDTNNQLIPKDYIDPTPLAKKQQEYYKICHYRQLRIRYIHLLRCLHLNSYQILAF